jgi:hypothetical protein
MKIIVSSNAMLMYLSKILEFLKDEAKIIAFDHELQIDGFRYLGCEHKAPFDAKISVETLRNFQRFLRSISDQPITVTFGYYKIDVHSIII